MAKKKKGKEVSNDEGVKKNRLSVFLIVMLIVLIWLAIFVLCIRWDVGGFGSTVLQPVLKDVPVLNKILPNTADDDLIMDKEYPYTSLNEAIAKIKALETELKKAKEANKTDVSQMADLKAEIEKLKKFEDDRIEFNELKERFYNEVIYTDNAPAISEYKSYYESIDPANAEALYKQVVKDMQYDVQVQEFASSYSAMKPAEAAGIMEALPDQLELAAKILNAMDSDARGKILGAMKPDIAAKITKIMEP